MKEDNSPQILRYAGSTLLSIHFWVKNTAVIFFKILQKTSMECSTILISRVQACNSPVSFDEFTDHRNSRQHTKAIPLVLWMMKLSSFSSKDTVPFDWSSESATGVLESLLGDAQGAAICYEVAVSGQYAMKLFLDPYRSQRLLLSPCVRFVMLASEMEPTNFCNSWTCAVPSWGRCLKLADLSMSFLWREFLSLWNAAPFLQCC